MNDAKKQQLRRWEWCKEQMEKLIKLNAPKIITAHLIINLMLPRLISMCNCTEEASIELARLILKGIDIYTIKCPMCHKVDLERNQEYCVKCVAEIDQYNAQYDEYDQENEEIEE